MRIIIIGAGPGGYETALLAAKRGVEVVLIESGHVGGTCLNEGCIPTKSFCRNAEVLDTLKEASVFGVSDLSYTFDFSAVRDRKNAVVEQLRGGVESLLSNKLITLVRGKASFKDEHTVTVTPDVSGISGSGVVAVSDDTQCSSADVSETDVTLLPVDYTADYIIIATGSTSASLPIPGADLPGVITSKEILDIEEVPQRLCIIGGGVIGLEFASIFNNFGSEVTVIEYCKDILPRFDTDLAKRLKQSLGKRGVEIFTQSQVLSIASDCEAAQEFAEHGISLAAAGQLAVTFSRKGKDETVVADKVLMAVGRRPAVSSLNLSDIGIEYSPKGIVVNDSMQTNIPHIYAVGDINGKMMLAHAATFQGIVALDHIMGLTDDIDLSVMPAAVFTSPEAATVGMTEDECKDKGISVKCLKSFFRANGKAVTMGETDGFCKIVVDQSGRILGCHIFGPHSSDIIQEITALINSKATVDDLRNIIHTHPTLTEVLQSAVHQ